MFSGVGFLEWRDESLNLVFREIKRPLVNHGSILSMFLLNLNVFYRVMKTIKIIENIWEVIKRILNIFSIPDHPPVYYIKWIFEFFIVRWRKNSFGQRFLSRSFFLFELEESARIRGKWSEILKVKKEILQTGDLTLVSAWSIRVAELSLHLVGLHNSCSLGFSW